ncbi:MAG: zinc-binding dehydrogenase [Actinomycetota bacterium]|nr:zinc-binding dehydrogenase [Actinomycetota bacterium]
MTTGTKTRTIAAQMVEVGRIECVEADVEPLDDGEVMVRNHYASVCGSDLHVVCAGVLAPPPPAAPGFPGHEGVGTVTDSRDPRWSPGDRVLCVPDAADGRCFAALGRISGDRLLRLPAAPHPARDARPTDARPTDARPNHETAPTAQPSDLELLMAQQLGTVIYARHVRPHDPTGETVVVVGQGSAGLFFTWLLRRAGAGTIIVADRSAARLELARSWGADVAVHVPHDRLEVAVADLTGGRGADYVVEAVGSSETLLATPGLVRVEGELLWFGLPDTSTPVPFDFSGFFRRRLRASTVWGAQQEQGLRCFAVALDTIARGDLDVTPLLSHVVGIERVGEAFEMAHDPVASGALKVSLDLGADST